MRSECIDHGCKGYGIGYATAWVWYDGRKRPTTKHRRVYFEATGAWPPVVRHKCDNPRCINIEHLVGGTHVDNMRDRMTRGRFTPTRLSREANGRSKLTGEDVKFIRESYRKGSREFGLPALARLFGVGTSQVWRIVKEVHWNGDA